MTHQKCPFCGGIYFSKVSNLYDDRFGSPNYYDVRICKKCGYGRTTPGLKDTEIADFYSKYYPLKKVSSHQVKEQVEKKNKFFRWLTGTNNVSHLYIQKNKKILDVGSASGVSLLEIKNKGSFGYGVEPDPSGIKLAKKLGLNVYKGTLYDNPFPDVKFNYITASQVIEHVSDPIKFLKIARGKLSSSGKIIVSVPNNDSIWKKIFNKRWINWHIPYHISHFSKRSIYLLAEKADLKITCIKTITPNIWTAYQVATIFNSSTCGKPTPLWTGDYSDSLIKKINSYLIQLLYILVTPISRLIDALALGDSMLVIMEKK